MSYIEPDPRVVQYLYDSAELFIPIIVGYAFAYCGAIGFLWKEQGEHFDAIFFTLSSISVLLLIGALGLWCGVIAFCIWYVDTNLDIWLIRGRWSGRFGLILFFASVFLGALALYLNLWRNRRARTGLNHS